MENEGERINELADQIIEMGLTLKEFSSLRAKHQHSSNTVICGALNLVSRRNLMEYQTTTHRSKTTMENDDNCAACGWNPVFMDDICVTCYNETRCIYCSSEVETPGDMCDSCAEEADEMRQHKKSESLNSIFL